LGLVVLGSSPVAGVIPPADPVLLLFFQSEIKMSKFVKLFVRDDRGVSALEYAILAGIIVGVLVTAVTAFGSSLSTAFSNLGSQVTNATTATGSGSSGNGKTGG
jgi:pilus assembly protein Flp/PilA